MSKNPRSILMYFGDFFMTLFQAILALDSSEKVRHVDFLVDHGTEL